MSRRRKRVRQRGQQQKPKPVTVERESTVGKYGGTYQGAFGSTSYARMCDHWRTPVSLTNGKTVYASGYFDRPRSAVEAFEQDQKLLPTIGFYLDDMWTSGQMMTTPGFKPAFARPNRTKAIYFPWQDQWVPESIRQFMDALRWLDEVIRRGNIVEVGCLGGHGRTGTTLAALHILNGMDANTAMTKVRREYCTKAIETYSQEQFLYEVDEFLHPEKRTQPRQGIKQFESTPQSWKVVDGEWVTITDNEYWEKDAYGRSKAFPDRDLTEAVTNKMASFESIKEEMQAAEDRLEQKDSWDGYDEWEDDHRLKYLENAQDKMDDVCDFPPCSRPDDCLLADQCFRGAVASGTNLDNLAD